MLAQSLDTNIDIEQIQISLLRKKSLATKFSHVTALSQTTRQLSKRAIKRANPKLNDLELNYLFIKYLYNIELTNDFTREQVEHMKKNDLIQAMEPLVEVFNQLGILYYIGGSVASSVYGMPRATQDIDLVTDLEAKHVKFLEEKLQSAYYIDKEMILNAIENRGSFNLLHFDTMMKIDIFLKKDEPYHKVAFERKRQDTLDEEDNSLKFFFASSEDIILSKLDWYRLGDYISEQQWRDIQGILKIQRESLDIDYLYNWAIQLGLKELLEKAFRDAGYTNENSS
ncbi:hypothetical protein [Candidatus Marithrix sp. Canyon 246]|nr:hypothetical protein [Candidatus Marithrix sp. Canyon 246]